MMFKRVMIQGKILLFTAAVLSALSPISGCSKKDSSGGGQVNPPPPDNSGPFKTDVVSWVTNGDKTSLFKKQNVSIMFTSPNTQFSTIEVNDATTYQTIDGFGYTLTGGSATHINKLQSTTKDNLLNELFRTDSTYIGVSYLRISIGASDLSAQPFTYDEVATGQTDVNLDHFTIEKEQVDLIPVLKKIIAINPDIKVLGSPWTAPTWMKDNNAFKGGSLKPEYYQAYANYFVKYIQAMKAEGITIDAITPQNEPLHGGNNPSMVMQAADQAKFIRENLGPAFKAANIDTKIIVYDHNADRPDYPIAILDDAQAKTFVDGSAFHLYGGDISALTQVHNAHPDKNVYFTEQWVGGPGNFGGDLSWHTENLIIGATRNWSRNVLEWNLAADPNYRPYTDGGCNTCLGALTVNGNTVSRNVSYYIIAQAAKFVRPGSVRIASNLAANLPNVAFKNPDGKRVLIVLNKATTAQSFNIKYNNKTATATLNAGSVGTYIF